MDARIFRDEPFGLTDDLLTVPLEARFSYDAARNIFFLNMEGLSVSTPADAEAITAEIEKRLAAVGKTVPVAVNYDNFYLAPDLADTYASVVRSLAERYYDDVTRYTTSSFLRLKLSGHLAQRGLAPHIDESRQEALDWLNTQHRQHTHSTGNRSNPASKETRVSVYRVTEVIGVSDESREAAARNAVETAAATVCELRIAEVIRQDVTIENGHVTGYRVRLAISFKYESSSS